MHSFKKVAAAVVVAGLLATPVAAFAQTTSTSSLQALLSQIAALQEQIQSLQTQKQEVVATLVATLKQGDRGENVRMLQQLLAADPNIYPEGTVSGFYGRLTAQAIKRFQKQHGISQVGNVGPQTLKRLNEIFGKKGNHGNDDDDDDNEDDDNDDDGNFRRDHEEDDFVIGTSTTPGAGKTTICHKPGRSNQTIYVANPALQAHLRHGDSAGVCGGGAATTTPDTTAPTLSSVVSGSVATTTALISWNTNEAATGKVYFGTANPLVLGSASTNSTSTMSTAHSFTLSGLTASTTYYFVVESNDGVNNIATSSQMSFTTTN